MERACRVARRGLRPTFDGLSDRVVLLVRRLGLSCPSIFFRVYSEQGGQRLEQRSLGRREDATEIREQPRAQRRRDGRRCDLLVEPSTKPYKLLFLGIVYFHEYTKGAIQLIHRMRDN